MHIAQWIVAVVAIWNFGGLIVDALIPVTAKQHLRNPRWPPHAKFHNCQTMMMGIFLGFISLTVLFGPGPLTFSRLTLAAAIAGTYFIGMLFVSLFPGTAWHDPEFVDLDPMLLGMSAQKLLSLIISALLVFACLLAYLRPV